MFKVQIINQELRFKLSCVKFLDLIFQVTKLNFKLIFYFAVEIVNLEVKVLSLLKHEYFSFIFGNFKLQFKF